MQSRTPHVVLGEISKTFKSSLTLAVDSVSLEVFKGESVTLLGPSGCGKTTTLRMIAGLERADSGTISIGRNIVFDARTRIDLPPERRNAGMVFQSYAIWPHMSVAENVAFPLHARRIAAADVRVRVNRALETVGLAGFGERPATRLSGGQQQRVAFARALVHEPEVLLLDEPLSNLDVKLREQMQIELKSLQTQQGWTVINVTHDQTEALGISDRIFILNRGRIEQGGAPRELYERPRTKFVRDFLGKAISLTGKINGRSQGKIALTLRCAPDLVWECSPGDSGSFSAGDEVEVSIRPEAISTLVGADRQRVDGRVVTALYQGDRTLCDVAAGGEKILCYLPGGFLPASGEEMALYLPASAMQVWRK